MPQPTNRARAALLGATLVAVALAAAACLGGNGEPVLAQPAALWAAPDHYQGKLVRTTGVVRGFLIGSASEHYVVEDPEPHRVQLLGVDHARLAAMEGRTVVVVGRFHFSETSGYAIDVTSIAVTS